MATCNNCNGEFNPLEDDGVVTTQRGRQIAAICADCAQGVRVGKIVLRRGDVGGFSYDQWSPMEMMGGGLTSKKAG